MNELPTSILFGSIAVLLVISAFFSGSETSLMALNRYRLRHLAKHKHRGARRAYRLLKRPDRLIGVILICNNFVNILASAVATLIAVRLWGNAGIAAMTLALTLVILIFSEVSPKTMAARHPERFAFPATLILKPLLRLLHPLVVLVNGISNGLIRIVGGPHQRTSDHLSTDELRTVLDEAGALIPERHQEMLMSILDLENLQVEDIMIPRGEVVGIDLSGNIQDILQLLKSGAHTNLPVFDTDLNKTHGMLHIRDAGNFLAQTDHTKASLLQYVKAPYFVPVTTPLHTQLFNFQHEKRRMALAVDEYGDIQGLVTLEDILEEIVGEFAHEPIGTTRAIEILQNGSYRVDGSTALRDINKALGWDLPTDGPKTLNGLVLEQVEAIPEGNVGFRLKNYLIETLEIQENVVKSALLRLDPNATTDSEGEDAD